MPYEIQDVFGPEPGWAAYTPDGPARIRAVSRYRNGYARHFVGVKAVIDFAPYEDSAEGGVSTGFPVPADVADPSMSAMISSALEICRFLRTRGLVTQFSWAQHGVRLALPDIKIDKVNSPFREPRPYLAVLRDSGKPENINADVRAALDQTLRWGHYYEDLESFGKISKRHLDMNEANKPKGGGDVEPEELPNL